MSGERALLLVGMLLSWGCPGEKVGTGDSGKSDDSGDSGDSDSAVDADDSAHTDDSSATDDSAPPPVDNDGDGYDSTIDCDDTVADPPTNTSSVITLGAVPACDKTARISGMLVGEAEGSYVESAAWSGDINGDGFGDILAESDFADGGEMAGAGVGYLVFGPVDGVKSLVGADTAFSAVEGAVVGGVSGLGDTNSDGYDDLAIPQRGADGSYSVYLFEGPLIGDIKVESPDAAFDVVSDATAAGDFDGDGLADLLANTTELVFLAPFSGSIAESDAYFSYGVSGPGCTTHNSFAIGDISADGLDDIVLTCGGIGAYFFYGGTSGSRDTSEADAFIGDDFDGARAAGDNDGDGYDDVVLGQLAFDGTGMDDEGRQYLYLGPIADGSDPGDADAMWYGDGRDAYLYATAACGADMNADGFDDVVLVSRDGDFGYAHIMLAPGSGVATQADADWSLSTYGTDSFFLEQLGRLGDTDGDGYEDIALGNPLLSVYEPKDGAVWILSGGTF